MTGESDRDREERIGRTGEFVFRKERIDADTARAEAASADPIPTRPDRYREPERFHRELKRAEPVFRELSRASAQMIKDVRVGRSLQLDPVREPLQATVASIIRHPDPMVWMTRMQVPDSYLIGHSQRCAVVSTVLGRTMGLPEAQLERLAWGGLLCQIGKTKIPRRMLEKPGPLQPEELARIQQFVDLGVDMLKQTPGVDEAIIEIVQHHHERFDGSGYPRGTSGSDIPVLARMVGLVDWFDAMTSRKPYTDNVISSTEAMDHLHAQRNVLFQDQLVEEFVRAVGLYPTGSLVELSSGEVALVVSQHPGNRTQPEVMLILDERKRPLDPYQRADLQELNRREGAHPKTVARALSQGEHDLDPQQVMAASFSQRKGWRRLIPGA